MFVQQRDDTANENYLPAKQSSFPSDASPKAEDNSFQGLKNSLAENLRCRESLNSSGTVSRKTSTASDYTPESTYVQENKSKTADGTSGENCIAAVAVECSSSKGALPNIEEKERSSAHSSRDKKELELALEIPKSDDVEYKPGQKIELNIVLLRQDSTDNVMKDLPEKLDMLEKIDEIQPQKDGEETCLF